MDSRITRDNIEEELDIQFSALRQEKNHFKGFSIEALHLLVQMQRNKMLAKHKNHFNCWVVALESRHDGINTFLNCLLQIPSQETPTRMQFIIKNGGHYTAMDVSISSNGNQCIILDAIGDLRGHMLAVQASALTDSHDKKFFSCVYLMCPAEKTDILQIDSFSCPIFAYDHAYQAAKIENLYDYLAEQNIDNDDFFALSWMQAPAKLVWNSQSAAFIKAYIKQHHEEEALFSLTARFDQSNKENKTPKLATELLFKQYQKRYQRLKTKNSYEDILVELAHPTSFILNPLSLSEKLILIVHAHEYWLHATKKNKLPKRIQKMQDARCMQEFIGAAESTGYTPTLFKQKVTQSFYKAIQDQNEAVIDEYYQQVAQYHRN